MKRKKLIRAEILLFSWRGSREVSQICLIISRSRHNEDELPELRVPVAKPHRNEGGNARYWAVKALSPTLDRNCVPVPGGRISPLRIANLVRVGQFDG